MLLRSWLACGALLLLACESSPPPNDAQAAAAEARAAARTKLFSGCAAKMVEKNVVLTCEPLILTVLRVKVAINDEAAAANQDNFEKEFPPTMQHQRSRPTVAGKNCWASSVEGPEGAWGKLLIVPVGPAEGLMLSCGSKDRGVMPHCEQMFEELAQGYTPPVVVAALKSSATK
jgi:hypothetical protein